MTCGEVICCKTLGVATPGNVLPSSAGCSSFGALGDRKVGASVLIGDVEILGSALQVDAIVRRSFPKFRMAIVDLSNKSSSFSASSSVVRQLLRLVSGALLRLTSLVLSNDELSLLSKFSEGGG